MLVFFFNVIFSFVFDAYLLFYCFNSSFIQKWGACNIHVGGTQKRTKPGAELSMGNSISSLSSLQRKIQNNNAKEHE